MNKCASSQGDFVEPNKSVVLDNVWIRETLSLYLDEYIAVKSASFWGNKTSAVIHPLTYPFTRPGHIEYITASMAALYIAQVGYLHIRAMIEHGHTPHLSNYTTERFFSIRDSGNILFTKLAITFREKIAVTNPIPLKVWHTLSRQSHGTIASHIGFEFGHHSAEGTSTCFLVG